jgi:hypothetical protein
MPVDSFIAHGPFWRLAHGRYSGYHDRSLWASFRIMVEFVRETVETCGLDLVQLHGQSMAAARCQVVVSRQFIIVDIATDPGRATSKRCGRNTTRHSPMIQ